MKAIEFKAAMTLAASKEDLSNEDIDIFNGYGMEEFNPIYVTIKQVARLIRWQAINFAGKFVDMEVQDIKRLGKKRFIII